MLIVVATLIALAIVILVAWIARRNKNSPRGTRLHRVDTAAFRNLLSETDEEFLRTSLSSARYRKVRRSRLRAVQEYLLWIADDCEVLLAMIRMDTLQPSREVEAMSRKAVRLRVVSLAFWVLLWVEYLIPALQIQPSRALGSYEEFSRSAELFLRRQQSQFSTGPS